MAQLIIYIFEDSSQNYFTLGDVVYDVWHSLEYFFLSGFVIHFGSNLHFFQPLL